MARTQHPCSPGPLAAAGLVGGLAIVAATGALAAEELDDRTYYFGELHAHTGYSADGGSADLGNCQGLMCGNAADFFATLRQAAGLDFGAITDHVNGPSMAPESWETVIGLVDEANDPEGGFVSLLGAEVVIQKLSGTDLGHKNLLFFGDEAALSAIPFEDTAACDSPDLCDDLWACIAGLDDEYGPLLFVPHHPAQLLPMVTKWGCHSERYSPVVEVYSSHGNARDDPAFDPWDTSFWGTDLAYTVNEALAQDHWGYRLGLIGGTDFHDSWPGMVCHLDLLHENQLYGGSITGIVLDADEAFDRMAVYRALKARHTYVTSGPQIPVAFVALDDAGADLAIGGDVTAPPASSQLTLRVSVPDASADYVLSVDLYTSDRVEVPATEVSAGRYELTIDTPAEPFFAYAVVALDGALWWADNGVICTDGGDDSEERVWTSPIWIEQPDTVDDDGDGFSEADGDCDDLDPALHPDAEETANGLDDDCDGLVDEDLDDVDGDGDGFSPEDGDCDDADPTVNPGVAETPCNGVDDDCDPDTEDAPGDDCDGEGDDDTGDDDTDDDDTDDDDCNCRTASPGIPAWPPLVLLSLIAVLVGRRRDGRGG